MHRYFRKHPEGYEVRQAIKQLITFKRENLLAQVGSTFEGLDLIMCRNLLIYLNSSEQRRLLFKFDRWLREGGYLVLGKTEFLSEPLRRRYETISLTERIYRKQTARSGEVGGKYEG